jgi:hypothetical protein
MAHLRVRLRATCTGDFGGLLHAASGRRLLRIHSEEGFRNGQTPHQTLFSFIGSYSGCLFIGSSRIPPVRIFFPGGRLRSFPTGQSVNFCRFSFCVVVFFLFVRGNTPVVCLLPPPTQSSWLADRIVYLLERDLSHFLFNLTPDGYSIITPSHSRTFLVWFIFRSTTP